MKKNLIFKGLVAGVAVFATAQIAKADSIGLELISGTQQIALSANALTGIATGSATVNGWDVVSVTSTTYPATGSAASPYLETISITVDDQSAGNSPLYIYFSGTDNTATTPPDTGAFKTGLTLNNLLGATLSASYSAYYDTGNTVDTNSTLLGGGGVTQIGSTLSETISTSASATTGGGGPLPGTQPYSLAQVIEVTGVNGADGSITASLSVPDGGTTVLMFGGALLGLAGLASLRTRKA